MSVYASMRRECNGPARKRPGRVVLGWTVQAQAFNRVTGAELGKVREERVALTNPLFASCKTAYDVKQAYEAFWNETNFSSTEVVFVQRITEAL